MLFIFRATVVIFLLVSAVSLVGVHIFGDSDSCCNFKGAVSLGGTEHVTGCEFLSWMDVLGNAGVIIVVVPLFGYFLAGLVGLLSFTKWFSRKRNCFSVQKVKKKIGTMYERQ
jgi:hypothetical protein